MAGICHIRTFILLALVVTIAAWIDIGGPGDDQSRNQEDSEDDSAAKVRSKVKWRSGKDISDSDEDQSRNQEDSEDDSAAKVLGKVKWRRGKDISDSGDDQSRNQEDSEDDSAANVRGKVKWRRGKDISDSDEDQSRNQTETIAPLPSILNVEEESDREIIRRITEDAVAVPTKDADENTDEAVHRAIINQQSFNVPMS